MKEIWRDIKEYEGLYQVSNIGQVRSLGGTNHSRAGILKFKGVNSKNIRKIGYRVDLWKDKKPHSFLVARLVAFTFYEEDINNHQLTVNHIDGNRLNNKLENLELISLKENIQHAFRTGLQSKMQIKVKIEEKIKL